MSLYTFHIVIEISKSLCSVRGGMLGSKWDLLSNIALEAKCAAKSLILSIVDEIAAGLRMTVDTYGMPLLRILLIFQKSSFYLVFPLIVHNCFIALYRALLHFGGSTFKIGSLAM